jgi:hypothetical protein
VLRKYRWAICVDLGKPIAVSISTHECCRSLNCVLDTRTSGIIYSIPSGSDRAVNSLHYLGFTRQLQRLAQGGESDKQNLTVGGKGENLACILCM